MATSSASFRPAVGIERLPVSAAARRLSNEPRESMNCKSCRKRKIKCNRLRPTCEACQVFQCPCVYDAVPKKRGPKTDVLEALLKRVDGLERRLKDEKQLNGSKDSPSDPPSVPPDTSSSAGTDTFPDHTQQQRPNLKTENIPEPTTESAIYTPTPSVQSPAVADDVLLDAYFGRAHGKPYFILDEGVIRSRAQAGTAPNALLLALYAVGARYAVHPNGYHAAVRLSEEYATRARAEVNIDEPSIETLQALLLLSLSFIALGSGKKAYMLLGSGIGMAMALELHREADPRLKLSSGERSLRRRLFWSCYLMDRFASCGSKRPSMIPDSALILRLPSWSPNPQSAPVEGEFFQDGSNLQYHAGSGKTSQGGTGLLIDIVRILGNTSRYLAAGGVKGDSHFPWHSLSNLSKIRQDLDIWASGTADVFASTTPLFHQPDSTILILAKLIYHLIHVLIYRPFLPIDLAELAGTGQHQSWQIEATNLCFLHANAIAELVELGRQAGSTEWPAFVGYCVCSAGTVHVHGSHYKTSHSDEVFSSSPDLLSRSMHQLSKLRYTWALVQHQRDTLQALYAAHAELLKNLASSPMRYSPVFHLEDFFDRYAALGASFDGAHVSFAEVALRHPADEEYRAHNLHALPTSTSSHFPDNVSGYPPPTAATGKRKRDTTDSNDLPTRLHDSSGGANGANNPASATADSFPHLDFSNPSSFTIPNGGGGGTSAPRHPRTSMSLGAGNGAYPDHLRNGNGNGNQFSGAMGMYPLSTPPPGAGGDLYHAHNLTSASGHQNNHGAAQSPHAYDAQTPSAGSGCGVAGGLGGGGGGGVGGVGGEGGVGEEKDPFLTLLEQLAENEYSGGGPSELDFFLGSVEGGGMG
ncbi:hypothetical protein VE03_06646 [Pseudogymnoascus sp. 23342-1-I1]|nr:hypothetical protein VE03_06646 [Pseudogymnoascus sp. 23342-1-I1]